MTERRSSDWESQYMDLGISKQIRDRQKVDGDDRVKVRARPSYRSPTHQRRSAHAKTIASYCKIQIGRDGYAFLRLTRFTAQPDGKGLVA